MTLADIPAGTTVFVDANIFLFALTNHPSYGVACATFLERVEHRQISAVTAPHILGEVVHRMMTIEACGRFGWPIQGIAHRLRRHPAEVRQLVRPRQALDEIDAAGVSLLSLAPPLVALATDLSRQTGLLYGDALVIATMQHNRQTHLASLDTDFDRVAGITRYAPA